MYGREVYSIQADTPLIINMTDNLQVDNGFEDKGIIVSGSDELVVTVVKLDAETDSNHFVDAYQATNLQLAGRDHFLLL